MKPGKKKKIDIKAFFLLHAEKIVLAVFVPLALYIAYQGTKYQPLTWQPDSLRQASDAADNFIRTNERKASDVGVVITPYDTHAEWIKVGVQPTYYRTETLWMPPLFPERLKRGEVPLFAVHDLNATSGLGAVPIDSNFPLAGTLRSETGRVGKRWAVITGLIPIKQQLDVYVNAYSASAYPDPERDTPAYYYYEIQRAEAQPGRAAADLQWTKLDIYQTTRKNLALWGGVSAADPVDPTYLAPVPSANAFPMAFPLPPVDKPFGEEVAHPPEIPLLTKSQTELMKEEEKIQQKRLEKIFDGSEEDILKSDPFTNTPSTAERARRERDVEESEIKPVLVEHYLFRFFDYDVEPGKTYRYRVRLYLVNPNYRLGENYLLDPALATERFLTTNFSDISNTVTIPLESRVLVGNVIAPSGRTPWDSPAASILAVYFNMEDGSEWYIERERAYRGQTVNYLKQEGVNPMIAPTTTTPEPAPGRRPPRTRQPVVDESKKTIDFISEVCLLDMTGGISLVRTSVNAPELRSPGKTLVLEPSGNMLIRQVDTDLAEVELIKHPAGAPVGGGSGGGRGRGGGGDDGVI